MLLAVFCQYFVSILSVFCQYFVSILAVFWQYFCRQITCNLPELDKLVFQRFAEVQRLEVRFAIPGAFLEVQDGLRPSVGGESLVSDVRQQWLRPPEIWQLPQVSRWEMGAQDGLNRLSEIQKVGENVDKKEKQNKEN